MRDTVDREFQTGLRSTRYLPEMESLRGLAVLLVFLFHLRGILYGASTPLAGAIDTLASVGNTGVTLFFVLSGFLLSGPWILAAATSAPSPSLKNFALARAARILPLYYLTALVAALDLGKPDLLVPAFTFQMLGFQYFPYSVVWWTLITEVQFYLLLPLLGQLWLSSTRSRWMLLLLFIGWLYWYLTSVVYAPEPLSGFLTTKSVLARMPAFIMGLLVRVLFEQRVSKASHWTPAIRALLLLTALSGLTLLLNSVAVMTESVAERRWPVYHVWEAMCWGGVILALAGGDQGHSWRLPFVNRPLAILGKLSYSIYLVHVPILFYLIFPVSDGSGTAVEFVLRVAASVVLSGLVAALTYRWIERPFLLLKSRLRVQRGQAWPVARTDAG